MSLSGPQVLVPRQQQRPRTAHQQRDQAEAQQAARALLAQHDAEGFGGCTNIGACSTACPKGIPQDVISTLNHDLMKAWRTGH